MTKTTIGIDISKATLDVHRLSDGDAMQFSNDGAGFRSLEHWLHGHAIARIVYEPTRCLAGHVHMPEKGPIPPQF